MKNLTYLLALVLLTPTNLSTRADDTSAAPPAAITPSTTTTETKIETKTEVKTESKESAKTDSKKKSKIAAKDKTAVIATSMGDITVKLFADRSPIAVENFIGLATGKKDWKDGTGQSVKGKPLYSGTIFHRVIPDFMIQGGDPMGNGTGGPGYTFGDEFHDTDAFEKPGILAMANSGPSTNGSQFFITVKPTPWLNGHHTIFGEVTKGMDVVNKIVSSPRDPGDRPNTPITIKKITIK